MGLLLLILSLFLFLGIGSSSSSTSAGPVVGKPSPAATSTSCSTVVTSVNGKTVRRHSCHSASGGSVRVHTRVTLKCTARMTADGKTTSRCLPPANP